MRVVSILDNKSPKAAEWKDFDEFLSDAPSFASSER